MGQLFVVGQVVFQGPGGDLGVALAEHQLRARHVAEVLDRPLETLLQRDGRLPPQ